MLLNTKIEDIVYSYSPVPPSIKLGNKLNSKDILQLSKNFNLFNLKDEIPLILSSEGSLYKYFLTDKYLYINNTRLAISKLDENIVWDNENNLLSEQEKQILLQCMTVIKNQKQEYKNTIDSFLNKYKKILNQDNENFENKQLFFDGKYIEMLKHETDELKKMCFDLNNDPHFIQSINILFSDTDAATDGYKAEHLLISDLIKVYNSVAFNENEKSRFILAYFFESLQGNDMAKGISIERLNQMVTNTSFLKNIEKIRSAKFIHTSKVYDNEYLTPLLLMHMEHKLFMKSGNCIYRIASIIVKADGTVNEEEKTALKEILEKVSNPANKISGIETNSIPEGDNLETVMAELESLTGLEEVKSNIKELANLLKVQSIRSEQGLFNVEVGLHAVFMGPPGTGKTTIARLLGRLYKHLGFLEKGHLIETDRAGMVAGYVGQTAIKVNDITKESLGGVLFIDEAYALTPQDGGRDFGSEAVDTLLKRMEDLRHELVVIVAGYTEPMKFFIESNPGLRSRFNRFFKFDHFLPTQLLEIIDKQALKSDFNFTEDAKDKLLATFEMLYKKRDEGFGNARVVRNMFEKCIQNQANRIVQITPIMKEVLQTIIEEDIPEPQSTVEQVYFTLND